MKQNNNCIDQTKEISGHELKSGKYYLRVFSDIYDDKNCKWVRRGVDIKISGIIARSLSAALNKIFDTEDNVVFRRVDGFRGNYNTPLCSKRYRADINLSVSVWNGENFENKAGFMFF